MKNTILIAVTALASLIPAPAQNLTPAQKEADFRFLVSLYDTYYAPLAWKKQLFGFDALNVSLWLPRVAQTQTDLDFYDLCAEYIAGLQDTHAPFILPSDFSANLNFAVDIYDGVPIVEGINRTRLPATTFPFLIGDELVSIDGEDALTLVERFKKYTPRGNPRASLRQAANFLTIRPQSRMPYAAQVGDTATVVLRRQSDGSLVTFTMPWTKTGTPLEAGPIPSATASRAKTRASAMVAADPLEEAQHSGVIVPPLPPDGLIGYGARNPVFTGGLPATFVRRFGSLASDFYYSGVFTRDNLRIGYIRIPNYSPASQPLALAQFESEIAFMEANTDGLIIDEMRNTGGNLCFGENIAARLHRVPFQATGFELRAFWSRVIGFYNAWVNAVNTGQSAEVVAQYETLFREMLAANQAGSIATKPLPLCTSSLTRQPATNAAGEVIGYSKPLMVMIDEFSTSTADSFAAMMQDSGRALIYGTRSNGAGGNNTSFPAGNYTETIVGLTLALQSRPLPFAAPDFPASVYIENVGVRPTVEKDYMTRENLLNNGVPFINAFLESMAAHIRQTR